MVELLRIYILGVASLEIDIQVLPIFRALMFCYHFSTFATILSDIDVSSEDRK